MKELIGHDIHIEFIDRDEGEDHNNYTNGTLLGVNDICLKVKDIGEAWYAMTRIGKVTHHGGCVLCHYPPSRWKRFWKKRKEHFNRGN